MIYDEIKAEWKARNLAERNRKAEKTCQSCGHDKAWHYDGKCNIAPTNIKHMLCNCFIHGPHECNCKEYISIV